MSSVNNAFNNYYTTNNNYYGAMPNVGNLNTSSYTVLNPNAVNPGMAASSANDLSSLLGNPFSNQTVTTNNYTMGTGFGVQQPSPYNINVTQNYGNPFNNPYGVQGGYGLAPYGVMPTYQMPPMMPGYGLPQGYAGGYASNSAMYNRMMDFMSGIMNRITDFISSRNTPAPAPTSRLADFTLDASRINIDAINTAVLAHTAPVVPRLDSNAIRQALLNGDVRLATPAPTPAPRPTLRDLNGVLLDSARLARL